MDLGKLMVVITPPKKQKTIQQDSHGDWIAEVVMVDGVLKAKLHAKGKVKCTIQNVYSFNDSIHTYRKNGDRYCFDDKGNWMLIKGDDMHPVVHPKPISCGNSYFKVKTGMFVSGTLVKSINPNTGLRVELFNIDKIKKNYDPNSD